ncbi:MAG: DUF6660 family protein [Bacteroidota bacterium]|nr:DUF6660 family protein [Bacteroidota bacterium]
MRLISIILSIIVGALSVLPCSDNENCNQEKLGLATDHSNHQHEEDFCTPFCVCSCCGSIGFTISVPFFDIQITRYEISKTTIPYYSDLSSSYFYSFWQPPKLS